MLEVLHMIVDVFHQNHSIGNFWIEHQMERSRTNELSQNDSIEGSHIESVVIVMGSISKNIGNHEGTHGNLDDYNTCILNQVSCDKLVTDLTLFLANLAEHHDDHFCEAMVEMNLRLVHDFLSSLEQRFHLFLSFQLFESSPSFSLLG